MARRHGREEQYSGFTDPRLVAGIAYDLRNLDVGTSRRQRAWRDDDGGDERSATKRNERSPGRDIFNEVQPASSLGPSAPRGYGTDDQPNSTRRGTEREKAIQDILSRSIMNNNAAAHSRWNATRDVTAREQTSSRRDAYGDVKVESKQLIASKRDDAGDADVYRMATSSKRSPYGDEYITSREQPSSRRDNGRDVDFDARKGSRLRENEVDSTEYRRPRVVESDRDRANVIYREPSKTSRDRRDPPNPRRERRDDDSGYGTGRSSPTSRTVSTYGIRDERAVLLDRAGGGRSPAPRGNAGDGKARVVVYKRR